jgi:hypothetical protein
LLAAFGVALAVIYYNDHGHSYLSNTGNQGVRLLLVVSACYGECLGSVMLR